MVLATDQMKHQIPGMYPSRSGVRVVLKKSYAHGARINVARVSDASSARLGETGNFGLRANLALRLWHADHCEDSLRGRLLQWQQFLYAAPSREG
jgi:hypothetical protein